MAVPQLDIAEINNPLGKYRKGTVHKKSHNIMSGCCVLPDSSIECKYYPDSLCVRDFARKCSNDLLF